jgi:hypothetical protein
VVTYTRAGFTERLRTKSAQGDDYQLLIAMHWLIRLISDNNGISFIQAESNGIPGVDEEIVVDDIVIEYKNGQRRYIQAKKNQSQNRAWSLNDLADELIKIRDQLEVNNCQRILLIKKSGDLF